MSIDVLKSIEATLDYHWRELQSLDPPALKALTWIRQLCQANIRQHEQRAKRRLELLKKQKKKAAKKK